MKKIFFKIFFFTLLCLSSFEMCLAQQVIIKTNPFNPILGRYTLGAEVAITQQASLSLLVSRSSINFNALEQLMAKRLNIEGDLGITSWGFMPEYRYYFGQQSLKGFYIGSYGNYARMKLDIVINKENAQQNGNGSAKLNNYGLGVMTGYNFLTQNHFSIDTFFGLGAFGYNLKDININYQNENVVEEKIPTSIAGLFPRIGINLGYAF